ncbi:MAG: protein arginine kinase [Opitutales bacterium]
MTSFDDFIASKSSLIDEDRGAIPVVLSTRIRLARNMSDYPFPGWAKKSQRRDILTSCQGAIQDLPQMKHSSIFNVDELSALEQQVLVERHLISRELCEGAEGAGVVISRDQSCSIMINEEDHMRIQVLSNGFNFKRVWKQIDTMDSAIENQLNYAFSEDLGYLTACPTNVGTGMRASVMLHLPGLVLSGQMEKVVRAVNQLGMAVRGLFGEGSDATGSVFQISNQQTLGQSEEEILKRLSSVLSAIIEQEENARQRLLESESVKLLDKIGRAYGVLQNSHFLSSSEAMNLLSLIRLAIDLTMLPEDRRTTVDRLFLESQPGHVQLVAHKSMESETRDTLRASLLREQFQSFPPLKFSALDRSKS